MDIPDPYGPAARETQRALLRQGLKLASISAPPPNYTGGQPGMVSEPGQQERFRHDFRRVARYGTALNTACIRLEISDGDTDTLIENLRWASDFDPHRTLLIKANKTPGLFLADVHKAAEIVARADRDGVKLLFDASDAYALHGDIIPVWNDVVTQVGHVEIASPPDRTAPSAGPIDFKAFFEHVNQSVYQGWICAGYVPDARRTDRTLSWMRKILAG